MNMAKQSSNSIKKTKANNQKATVLTEKNGAGRVVLFRTLIIILADLIMASLFDFVKSNANRELAFHLNVHPVLKVVFGVLFALSIVYLVITLVKKIDTSKHYMTPLMITGLTLFMFASIMTYDQLRNSPFLFYTAMIIGSVLYVVYYVYTKLLYK